MGTQALIANQVVFCREAVGYTQLLPTYSLIRPYTQRNGG